MSSKVCLGRRRAVVGSLTALGLSALGSVGPLHAARLLLTPPQTPGPFYPLRLPLDTDNDLVRVRGRSGMAGGIVSNVVGRVVDDRGRAVRGARVEIWQCDANGRYHHPWDRRQGPLDENFQGYGRFTTEREGAYRFRTIQPVPYPGRAPHIHFAISAPGVERLVTQMYVAGRPENAWDGILNRIPKSLRNRVVVEFVEDPDQPAQRLARFDIVLAADGRFEQS
ncbi:MAG: intradiol ring-cleavage dioxygenase [Gammaproteobacteria bacterium]|nr:intradiol ring-cleavage dioxygenase [Gammaproteobacteria bacterium]NIR83350.1 intradiol ring-cleavage dioxygenase [Gammaproteobacteria bacterium]NIR91150.1 intradiol ring-cleavage dioxygenase [Gammaproteobacteria bacterium]NIU04517.1 intradiol ring-cleavage dioxygenase [Gammaproteobacteria bacterium]NIW87153.1 intradiol ring-cleavage dioxygenase [Gammaproteobacteria bacterium]